MMCFSLVIYSDIYIYDYIYIYIHIVAYICSFCWRYYAVFFPLGALHRELLWALASGAAYGAWENNP